jgi:hypothetical protein
MIRGWPTTDYAAILKALDRHVDIKPFTIDVPDFRAYLYTAPYPQAYRETFGPLFLEKALEHYVSLELLGETTGAVMDVASCASPFPAIAWNRLGGTVYRQDITYLPGIHRHTVGCPAQNMPFGLSVSAMTLHCAFEHFEGEADSGFIIEASRVLCPGGRLCILPLYVADHYANVTDPAHPAPGFDERAQVRAVPGWNNRFGRWYDVDQFLKRVLQPARRVGLDAALYDVRNATDVDPLCYLRLALILTRLSS